MGKKKKELEDSEMPEFDDLGEDESEEVEDENKELTEIKNLLDAQNEYMNKLRKAIMTNQNLIKQLYEKLKITDDNVRILTEQ